MATDDYRARNPVQSTRTTLRILEHIRELDGARVNELADRLDISKSSVHNYLATLREDGFVVKEGNRYDLGLRFLTLGAYTRNKQQIYEVGKPEIDSLAEETGEVANILVEEHGRGIYVYRKQSDRAVNMDARTGNIVHLHNTALGKAILAYHDEDRIDRIIDRHGLVKTSEHTITDREALAAELETIRDQGVAYDREERLVGLRCVAAPVRMDDSTIVGSISVAGPSSRLQGDRFEEELPELLRRTANLIEVNLSYE